MQAQPSPGGYAANTNLEQVSDWLTKLLLGAGLTQIARVPTAFSSLGTYLANTTGATAAAGVFTTIVVLNLLVGFFFGFLAARLRLGGAFYQADQEARGVLEADRKIRSSTDEVDFGPGMLAAPSDAPTLKEKVEARNLARTVEKLELTTSGPAFNADSYLRLAQTLVAGGQFDRALSLLEVGMSELPDDPSLPVYAGAICAMYRNDLEQAKQFYFRALSIAPGFAMAYYNLACATARESKLAGADVSGLLSQAVQLLHQAFANDPSLRTRVTKDPLWDDPDLLKDPDLAALVRPSSKSTTTEGNLAPEVSKADASQENAGPVPDESAHEQDVAPAKPTPAPSTESPPTEAADPPTEAGDHQQDVATTGQSSEAPKDESTS